MNTITLTLTLTLMFTIRPTQEPIRNGPVCRIQEDGACDGHRLFSLVSHNNVQDQWAHIVAGESSGQWPEGSLLVAWTLRAWQVHRGMPPELAGRRWGWNGWKPPTHESLAAVKAVWNQPPTAAPFAFMQDGHYCKMLISEADRRYLGLGAADFVLRLPGTDYQMLCYFD